MYMYRNGHLSQCSNRSERALHVAGALPSSRFDLRGARRQHAACQSSSLCVINFSIVISSLMMLLLL